jgi:hypothetical protein
MRKAANVIAGSVGNYDERAFAGATEVFGGATAKP